MKILLVQAYLGRDEPGGAIFPLGLCYIATALVRHDVQIFDPNISPDPWGELEGRIRDFKPHAVGISIRNIDTTQKRDIYLYFKTVKPTAQMVKGINPEVKVILGGAGFSIFAEKIMKHLPEADFGVYLEGEESFSELLDNLDHPERVRGIFLRDNGTVKFTGERSLPAFAEMPLPRRDLTDIAGYLHPLNFNIGIQTKRGCPLKCAYCNYQFLNGAKSRLRPAAHVVDEIEYLIREFDVRSFSFVDSVFNVPRRHAEEICTEIIMRGIDIKWSAWLDIKYTDEELLKLVQKAGCTNIGFSPDAITDKSLASLQKGIREEDVRENLRIVKRVKGFKAGYNFFIMPPSQDIVGFFKTLFLYIKIPFMLFGRAGCMLGWIRIEPHTKIYELALKEQLLQEDTNLLPEDEKALAKLFYICRPVKSLDWIAVLFLDSIEKYLKPAAKRIISVMKKSGASPKMAKEQ